MNKIFLKSFVTFASFLLINGIPKNNSKTIRDTLIRERYNVMRNYVPGLMKTNFFNLDNLVEDAINWAHDIGLVMRTPQHPDKSDLAMFVPFSLFPSPFPREIYEQARDLQKAMNLLYFRVSNDYEFLSQTLAQVAKTNATIRTLLNILHKVKNEGIKQPITLLSARSDYMCHVNKNEKTNEEHYELKQIEVNIGQFGGSAVAKRTTDLHRRTLSSIGISVPKENLPDNEPDAFVAEGLYMAWKKFGVDDAIVIIVAGKYGRNFEQFQLAHKLEEISENRIKIVRLSVPECAQKLELDENDFSLRYEGQLIAVVYHKTVIGNPSDDYNSARLKIERSTAIKNPSIGLELACAKKVQQALAMPGVLERFFPDQKDAETIDAIRASFAKMWGLEHDDDEATRRIIEDAIENPENYVMKPSKEGGGNNLWGKEIAEKLRTFSPTERAGYILMERLRPLVITNYRVRPLEEVKLSNIVNELSVFGLLLGTVDDMQVLHNDRAGYMIRSKGEHTTEGGMTAGGGVHDSPYLF